MFSFGTELFFAFCTASYRVGLPAGSAPPCRAATSTFLISFAKSLPRRASTTAFLCLVVAHLEWPDNAISSALLGALLVGAGQPHEKPMQPVVAADLRMERRREDRTLAYGDDPTRVGTGLDPGENLDPVADLLDPGGANQHRVERRVERREVEIGLERVDLTAERVAAHRDVEPTERLLPHDPALDPVGEQDHPGTRAEGGHPAPKPLAQRLEQLERHRELVHGGALAAGEDEPVDPIELLAPAYGQRGRAGAGQHAQVLPYIAL